MVTQIGHTTCAMVNQDSQSRLRIDQLMSGLGLKLGGNRTWVATIVVLQVANSTDPLASSMARIGFD